MSEPVLTDEDAMRAVPTDVWLAINGLYHMACDKGHANAIEESAWRRMMDHPYSTVLKEEAQAARNETSRRLDIVRRAQGELARAILAALAEAKTK